MQKPLQAGDRVLIGRTLISIDSDFAESLETGDEVLGIASSGEIKRIPLVVSRLASDAVSRAYDAFAHMASMSSDSVTKFFNVAAELLSNKSVFDLISKVNNSDVSIARDKGRSTTRLVLDAKMRQDMIDALHMWRDLDASNSHPALSIAHEGWTLEEWKAPLGVIGFVFEGRPNVFADAMGVLRGGNTVVFRIGSDALPTAKAIMECVVLPALHQAGLPSGAVVLLDSTEHAAGWALFSDNRLSLAVARGSGEAVAQLGAIAQQVGTPVSLHGTGGAWMIVGDSADIDRLYKVVKNSLDRKVCNTVNVFCVARSRAQELCSVIQSASSDAAASRNTVPTIHAVADAMAFFDDSVHEDIDALQKEWEWEDSPEFHVVLVDDMSQAVELFNRYSPHFIVSVISEIEADHQQVWENASAPFVGDGFTRWVDGQFALLRPELGLSNWQNGRLFGRSGVLSGDSAFTVRLKVTQTDPGLHR